MAKVAVATKKVPKSSHKTFNIEFAIERETKGAVRYNEVDDDGNPISFDEGAVIGTIYLRKSQLGGTVPEKLSVTIVTSGKSSPVDLGDDD